MIEYVIMLSLFAVGLVGILTLFRNSIGDSFTNSSTTVQSSLRICPYGVANGGSGVNSNGSGGNCTPGIGGQGGLINGVAGGSGTGGGAAGNPIGGTKGGGKP